MKEILTVFEFTLKDALKKKAFIVSTCIILAIIIVGCAVGGIVLSGKLDEMTGVAVQNPANEQEKQEKNEPESTCYVIAAPELSGKMTSLLQNALGPTVKFVEGDAAKLEEYKAEIGENSSVFAVKIELMSKEIAYEDGSVPPATPYLTFISSAGIFDSAPPYDSIAGIVTNTYLSELLSADGVEQGYIDAALGGSSYSVESLGGIDFLGYIIGIVLTVLMFMAVYYYGYFVAMSVASEKTSRVMETLIMSAKPSNILIGKCAAMGVAGLLQFVLILSAGAVSLSAFLLPKLSKLAELSETAAAFGLDLKAGFGIGKILLLVVYFILGYCLFAMMNSVAGASISRTEDLQAALMPTMMVAMISFYCGYIGIFMSGDGFRSIVSLVPFTSPFIMPYRLLNDSVAAWEVILSVVLLTLAISVVTIVSIKLYTASVLHYGQRLKVKDMFKLKY